MLARHADRAFPVRTMLREQGTVDAGGIVDGLTLPLPRLPLSESKPAQ